MTVVMRSNELGEKICSVLGIGIEGVRRVEIICAPDSLATIYVERFAQREDEIEQAFESYCAYLVKADSKPVKGSGLIDVTSLASHSRQWAYVVPPWRRALRKFWRKVVDTFWFTHP